MRNSYSLKSWRQISGHRVQPRCEVGRWFFPALILLLAGLMPRASAQSGPIVWVAKSLQRIGPDDAAGSGLQTQIYAARGEYESFQIIVKAPSSNALTNGNVTVSDLSGPGGAVIAKQNLALFREHYVYVGTKSPDWGGSNRPIGAGWYPDGLIPFADPLTGAPITSGTLRAAPFSVNASKNQPIWVDVQVPRNATPGQYSGSFTVTTSQGNVTGQISLTVWNFTLPLKPTLKSSFLYWSAGTATAIQELLRNRIDPANTPAASQRSLIDGFGLANQNTGFWSGADINTCSMSAPPSVSQMASTAAAQQPDLFLYNYTADEIDKCTNLYPTMKQWAINLHQAGIKNLVTMAPVSSLLDDGSGTGRSAVDVWVMLPVVYDGAVSMVKTAQAKGDEAWSYNTLVQDAYSPKWMLDFAPINFRVQPGFINQSLGLTGILYWRIDNWSSDPWNNIYAPGWANYPGESILVYPGSTVGIQGVAPSMRLKWLRDGADDFEYIDLLKKAGRGSTALSIAAGVGANWSSWTRDINALENARIQLGQQLDQLGGGGSTAPGTPANPSPASGTTSVSLTPTLSWTAASDATTYDCYFGTTSPPPFIESHAATTHNPGTLAANTTYYWKVVAKNSAGSTSSATWSFTTTQSAPAAPANPSPANGATGVSATAGLAWSAASDATSYDVYFGSTSSPGLVGTTTSTTYNPGTRNANTTYYWRVVAKNSVGSASSPVWSFTTAQAQTPAPGTPANPSPPGGATGVSTTSALTWSAASSATSYDVYFGTSASPGLVGTTTSTTYNPGTRNANTTYYWRVVAKNSAGSTSSAIWSFTTAGSNVKAPSNPQPADGATLVSTTTSLFWKGVTGATGYDVYLGAASNPPYVGGSNTASYRPGTLAASTRYYWRVVAWNSAGFISSSPVWSFTTRASSTGTTPTLGPVSVTPSSGAGLSQTFSFTFSAPNGLANANVLINASTSPTGACWFNYSPSSNTLALAADDGSTWTYATRGSATYLQNSQCWFAASAVTVSQSGATTVLTVPLNFKTFPGSKNIYMRVQDNAGTMTPFTALGSWTPSN